MIWHYMTYNGWYAKKNKPDQKIRQGWWLLIFLLDTFTMPGTIVYVISPWIIINEALPQIA